MISGLIHYKSILNKSVKKTRTFFLFLACFWAACWQKREENLMRRRSFFWQEILYTRACVCVCVCLTAAAASSDHRRRFFYRQIRVQSFFIVMTRSCLRSNTQTPITAQVKITHISFSLKLEPSPCGCYFEIWPLVKTHTNRWLCYDHYLLFWIFPFCYHCRTFFHSSQNISQMGLVQDWGFDLWRPKFSRTQ